MRERQLFGSDARSDEFARLASTRAIDDRTTDAITPTPIHTLVLCTSVITLSIAYGC